MLDRRRMYLVACVKSLLKRLPDNLELFWNFKYLTPSCVRDIAFCNFRKTLSSVNAHFDASSLEAEYGVLQAKLPSLPVSGNVCTFQKIFAKTTNSAGETLFPNLSRLALALFCLPASNAAVKRVFSQFFVTKTNHRNKMLTFPLKMIVHVRCDLKDRYGCCVNFEPNDHFPMEFNSAVMYE